MSHASASDRPAPTACPLIAAIVGFGMLCSIRLVARCDARRPSTLAYSIDAGERSPLSLLPRERMSRPAAMPFTSPPAQNARPAPVSTTTRVLRSRAASARYSDSSGIRSPPIAFRLSGRFSVSTVDAVVSLSRIRQT